MASVATPDPVPGGNDRAAPFFNSHLMTVDSVELHYRIWEPSPLFFCGKMLLVHGLGGSTYTWEANAGVFSRAGYLVLALDLPGFGFSSRQPGLDHSQEKRARLIWPLLQEIDRSYGFSYTSEGADASSARTWPWLLVGHSMGAGTVAAMALADPSRTAGLVFVDGALLRLVPCWARLLVRLPPVACCLAFWLKHVLLREKSVRKILRDTWGREPAPDQISAYMDPLARPGTARAMVDLTATSSNTPIGQLKDFQKPVFAIWGDQDRWVPVVQANQLKSQIPGIAVNIIRGAAHAPMETHSSQFNRLLLDIASPCAYHLHLK